MYPTQMRLESSKNLADPCVMCSTVKELNNARLLRGGSWFSGFMTGSLFGANMMATALASLVLAYKPPASSNKIPDDDTIFPMGAHSPDSYNRPIFGGAAKKDLYSPDMQHLYQYRYDHRGASQMYGNQYNY